MNTHDRFQIDADRAVNFALYCLKAISQSSDDQAAAANGTFAVKTPVALKKAIGQFRDNATNAAGTHTQLGVMARCSV